MEKRSAMMQVVEPYARLMDVPDRAAGIGLLKKIESFTQESTRFVNYEKKMPPSFIMPMHGMRKAYASSVKQEPSYPAPAPQEA